MRFVRVFYEGTVHALLHFPYLYVVCYSQTSVGTFTLPRVNLLEWASHNDFPTLIKELSLSLSWLQMLCRE